MCHVSAVTWRMDSYDQAFSAQNNTIEKCYFVYPVAGSDIARRPISGVPDTLPLHIDIILRVSVSLSGFGCFSPQSASLIIISVLSPEAPSIFPTFMLESLRDEDELGPAGVLRLPMSVPCFIVMPFFSALQSSPRIFLISITLNPFANRFGQPVSLPVFAPVLFNCGPVLFSCSNVLISNFEYLLKLYLTSLVRSIISGVVARHSSLSSSLL